VVKDAIRHVCKPVLRCANGVVALVLLVAPFAQGQTAQFSFDHNGNLIAQTEATGELPQILRQPQNQVVSPGEVASFSVVVADTRALSYQWHFNGNPIIGATSETLLRRDFTTSDEGQYTVVLVNPSGSVTSVPALLMIDTDRDGLADSWEQTYFGSLVQYSATDYDGDGVSNLSEFLDGTDPTNSASVLFRLTVMSDGGQITVTPSRFQFTNGETVTLTATAFAPHAFHAWAGEIESTNNPITLTMTNNKSIFAYLSSYDVTWANNISGNWFTLANWSPRVIPLSNDNVFLTQESVVTTLNGNAVCRSLTLGSSSANPTLTGTGELTILADSSWLRGTMSGSGRTVVSPNGSLEIGSGSTHFLSGGRTLENGGTVLWSDGSLTLGGITITNRGDALFEIRTATTLNVGGVNRFDNAGTFRKSVSTGTASWTLTFNNSGLVEIQTGRLTLNGSGTHSGRFEIAAGGSLNFAGGAGTHAADAASIITGAGDLIVNGGVTATLAGLVNPSGAHTFSSGIVNLNGIYICTSNPVTISGATVNFNGASTVAAVNLSSGTLGGTAVLSIMDTMNWSGGTMSGTGRTLIPAGTSLNLINGAIVTLNTRTLENGGTVIWSGGAGMNVNFAVITNRAGALFELRNNVSFVLQAGSSRFDNAGTFRKAVGGGTSTFGSGVIFNNYGTAEIQTGTLLFSSACTNNGAFALSPGTTLRLAGGGSASGSFMIPPTALVEWTTTAFTLNPGAQLNGAGLYKINGAGAALTCNTTATVENLDLLGILNGTGVVTVSNVMNWTSGTMGGSGRTRIAPSATLNINNSGVVMLQRTLENGGTTLWTGATITMDSCVITNRAGALFHAQNAATLMQRSGLNRFDNAGTFRKSGNTGTTTFTSLVSLNNYNTVEIRNGTLAANGGYTSTANALLNCAIGGSDPGTQYGRLQVAGTVNLNGALSVDFINSFTPVVNDSFSVLTAGTRSGVFANFSYPSSLVTMQLSNAANAVILRVTEVMTNVPQPTLLVPEIAGTNVRLTWTAVSNAVYRLEFKSDVDATNWNAIVGDLTASSNSVSTSDALTLSNRFYRVRVVQ
jgi:immunoglobulin I-set domain protein/List-Bact-rpt repeat protein